MNNKSVNFLNVVFRQCVHNRRLPIIIMSNIFFCSFVRNGSLDFSAAIARIIYLYARYSMIVKGIFLLLSNGRKIVLNLTFKCTLGKRKTRMIVLQFSASKNNGFIGFKLNVRDIYSQSRTLLCSS